MICNSAFDAANGTDIVITVAAGIVDRCGHTAQTLANVKKLLAQAGAEIIRILTAQIWLRDVNNESALQNSLFKNFPRTQQG